MVFAIFIYSLAVEGGCYETALVTAGRSKRRDEAARTGLLKVVVGSVVRSRQYN